jgi:hypothetical protein
MNPKDAQRLSERLTNELVNRGQIIEAGFVGLKLVAYDGVPTDQLEQLRDAFFAGALHLFSSIMSVMDDDREPTMQDMQRMAKIDAELRKFEQAFKIRHGMT